MHRQILLLLAGACLLVSACGGESSSVGGDAGMDVDVTEAGLACAELGRDDSDGDGVADSVEGDGDTDGDGSPDSLDTDSDGDGRLDVEESGVTDCESSPLDTDGDGSPDFQDTDADGNGIEDSAETDDDIDDDGMPDWCDIDDDGDGIDDSVELGADPSDPPDADQDGIPDYHDEDSDGDGIRDLYEGADDVDGDGLACFRDTDSDGDGWTDTEEVGAVAGGEPVDSDGDGAPDFQDTDSDDDRLEDGEERVYGTDRTSPDTDGDEHSDYDEILLGTDPLDATSVPVEDICDPGDCMAGELCGPGGNGDGLDNDCDGEVDEGCPCEAGETRSCFIGRPPQRNEGACADGIETCTAVGSYGPCVGGVWPEEETCDGADNDCDGLYDEELEGCESPLDCPATVPAPPLSTLELTGSDIYDGPFDSWAWEVFCPLTIDACPMPDDPTAQNTTVYLVSSGSYRVRASIVIDGDSYTCQFTVDVRGDGLRVELLWDTQGQGNGDTDVDLHVHRPDSTTAWFTEDDCHYANCKASAWSWATGLDWGFAHTEDVTACNEAPHGHGEQWEELGFCANPRLDVDVISCEPSVTDPTSGSFCAPENINVDNPELGQIFRIMVNYFNDHSFSGDTHPTVNIYCGGGLRGTFGDGDVVLSGTNRGPSNDQWLVADVEFTVDSCGAIDCVIRPIRRDDTTPWIQNDADFGPPY